MAEDIAAILNKLPPTLLWLVIISAIMAAMVVTWRLINRSVREDYTTAAQTIERQVKLMADNSDQISLSLDRALKALEQTTQERDYWHRVANDLSQKLSRLESEVQLMRQNMDTQFQSMRHDIDERTKP